MNDMIFQEKLAQAAGIMQELSIDAWLIFVRETALNPDPVTELLWDFPVIWPAAFVLTASGERIATAVVHDVPTLERSALFTQVIPFAKVPEETLPEIIRKLNPGNIALNYSEENVASDGLSHGLYLRLVRMLGTEWAERFISAEMLIGYLRQRKLASELGRLAHAAEVAATFFDDFGRFLKPGMTETEMAQFYSRRIAELGIQTSWDAGMCPTVNAGPHTGRGHQGPRPDVIIQRGDILNIDFGVKVNGYSSDQQRMWYLLREGEDAPPAEILKPFYAVVGAIQAGFEALRPGIPGKNVDAAARQYLVDHGYPEYLHALGHNVGHYAHDGGVSMLCPAWPSYGARAYAPIEPNQLFTLELGIWNEFGYFGLEEEALVTEDSARWFWPPQKELYTVR